MRRIPPLWLPASLALTAIGPACVHDWDAYLPGATTATASSGAGGTAGPGGGGGSVPGTCPVPGDGSELVKVATPSGEAMCIQATEVTRGQYEAWLATMGSGGAGGGSGGAGGAQTMGGAGGVGGSGGAASPQCSWNTDLTPAADWPPAGLHTDRPVAHVDWCDAEAYCRGNGMRLCGALGGGALAPAHFVDAAASEWFNACSSRGTQPFPYGASFDAAACQAGAGSTAAVASASGCRTPAGVLDLSGNVWEWEDACSDQSGARDSCRIRGGGFNNSDADSLGCGADSSPARSATAVNVGIRCCADPLP